MISKVSIYINGIDIDKHFKKLKSSIREGTSLLYDLDPLYMSINLGKQGIS